MNPKMKQKISDYIYEVESIYSLYNILMICFNYSISNGIDSNSASPLANIIEEKFNKLQLDSEKLYLEIHNT